MVHTTLTENWKLTEVFKKFSSGLSQSSYASEVLFIFLATRQAKVYFFPFVKNLSCMNSICIQKSYGISCTVKKLANKIWSHLIKSILQKVKTKNGGQEETCKMS